VVLRDGAEFEGYRIVRKLGEGGMGAVYQAAHPRLPNRAVALKVLRGAPFDKRVLRKFSEEADLLSRLSSPNIA